MNFSVVLGISFFSVSHEYFFFYFFSPFFTYFKLRHTFILLGSSYQWFGTELYIKYYGFMCVALSVSFILLLFSTFKYIMFIVSIFYHIFEWWHLMQNHHGKNSLTSAGFSLGYISWKTGCSLGAWLQEHIWSTFHCSWTEQYLAFGLCSAMTVIISLCFFYGLQMVTTLLSMLRL